MQIHVTIAIKHSQQNLEWNPICKHLLVLQKVWIDKKERSSIKKRKKSPKDWTDENLGNKLKVKSDQSDQSENTQKSHWEEEW